MARIKLTRINVERITITGKGQDVYTDTELQGFGLCVGMSKKTYFVKREVNGKTVKVTIGPHGVFSPEQARKEAQQLLAKLARGINPNEEKKAERIRGITLEEAYKGYMGARKNLKPVTIKNYDYNISSYFADWLTWPLTSISKDKVTRMHQKIGEQRGKTVANFAMKLLRAVFNYASSIHPDVITENPVQRLSQVKAWYPYNRRSNYIKESQLPAWFQGVNTLDSVSVRDCLLFLLFTGTRRNEALNLTWQDVDFKNKTLTIDDTKNGKPLTLPLSDYLFNLLQKRSLFALDSHYVFPGMGKHGHIINIDKPAKKLALTNGIEFIPHDLRRTFITYAANLNISVYAIKDLVNHSMSQDITATYKGKDIESLRKPMQEITDYILSIASLKTIEEI